MTGSRRSGRLRRYWDRQAGSYDDRMAFAERRLFGDTRAWLCGQAAGRTLEIAMGTGLNLPHYPPDVTLTGLEWSDGMIDVAGRRAAALGRQVELRRGDATALPYPDGSFDTVVCTFALCGIGDERAALTEMTRVVRSGGLILLADHVASSRWPVRLLQRLVDVATVPLYGEHYSRRPVVALRRLGVTVERDERYKLGIIERVVARKDGGG